MDKKSEPEVLDNTTINAKVDFNLNKDDLADMILEERYEALENRLCELTEQSKAIQEKMNEIDEEHEKLLIAMAKKELSKRVKAAEKLFGVRAEYAKHNDNNYTVSEKLSIDFETYESTYGSKRRRKTVKTKWINGWKVPRVVKAMFVVENKDKENHLYESGLLKIIKTFTEEEVSTMPSVKKLTALDGERKELEKQIVLFEAEIANLETSGKRARAKMVKTLLASSDQGKKLLSLMPKINRKLLTDGK